MLRGLKINKRQVTYVLVRADSRAVRGGKGLLPRELLQVKQAKRRLGSALDPPKLLGCKCSIVLSDFCIDFLQQWQRFPYSSRSWRLLLRLEAGDIKLWEPHGCYVFIYVSEPC